MSPADLPGPIAIPVGPVDFLPVGVTGLEPVTSSL